VNNCRQLALGCHLYLTENADRFCDAFVVSGNNVIRRGWFNLLSPCTGNTNLLLCPAFQLKANAVVAYNYPTAPEDAAFSNYAFNFQVGGCDRPTIRPESIHPPARFSAIRRPSAIVLLTDSGTRPMNTTAPALCVTRQSLQKAGSVVLNDPAAVQPNSLVIDPNNAHWYGPELRHNNGRSAVAMTVTWK
jgi:hypothetical protein